MPQTQHSAQRNPTPLAYLERTVPGAVQVVPRRLEEHKEKHHQTAFRGSRCFNKLNVDTTGCKCLSRLRIPSLSPSLSHPQNHKSHLPRCNVKQADTRNGFGCSMPLNRGGTHPCVSYQSVAVSAEACVSMTWYGTAFSSQHQLLHSPIFLRALLL